MGFRFLKTLHPASKSCISRLKSSQLCNSEIFRNSCAAANSEFYDRSTFYSENPNLKIFRRWHGGHSHHHHDRRDSHSGKEGEKIFRLGLAADIGLAAGKAFTGYVSGSTAIIADAAHSISDVVLSGVALFSFRAGRAPKDKEHPYGHGKFETLGALGISSVLLLTAGGIAWHAIDVLAVVWSAAPEIINQSLAHNHAHGHQLGGHQHGIDMEHPILALNMTIVSIGVKEGLYWVTKKAGEKTGSGLMKANAWHHRADAISSVVALIGVDLFLGVMELVDAAIPSQQLEPYKQTILGVEGVKGYNHLRGRRAGSNLYLDVDVEVDPFSSVSAAHDIGENVRSQLQLSHPEVAEVFIHIEPATSQIMESGSNHQRSCNSSDHHCNTAPLEPTDVEDTVGEILSSNFSEKMSVQRITRHSLQGQILLQIEVSMPPDTSIRDAVEVAKEAEKKILEVVTSIRHVSIQLQLGSPMPNFPQ
ncbi:metal tolerance protein C1 isoform X2 [Salvia miltiorrhiza]|uniref:metal tolerance protein C1 isoform X2 n=1 Tax=Salvia miltiorrhiza TaxID=226208 RepID=UPI0025AC6789|nr:metal tolerance protein C1 isoform X2 [Salvia miltiorrhiza]